MYMPMAPNLLPDESGAGGDSYGAILLPAEALGVADQLRSIRFTGWVAPPSGGWTVILGDPGDGVVASHGRGVIEAAAELADTFDPVLAVRVRRDRQLAIIAWRGRVEVARYCSDPSQEADDDEEVLPDPVGVEDAVLLAELLGRGEVTEKLTELLAEELDVGSVFESERLIGVLRMLDLPSWIVAAAALPRDIPTGPRAAELTHLRVGAAGFTGIIRNIFVRPIRRRRTPASVIHDPPRSDMPGVEPWML